MNAYTLKALSKKNTQMT